MKMRFPRLLSRFLILLLISSSGAAQAPAMRVLFIGNSYTYFNDLPTIFRKLAAAGGHRVDTRMVAPGG
jgi:hypothetical protein